MNEAAFPALSVLLAEDNPIILAHFLHMAAWKANGFSRIWTALDGEQAYRLFLCRRPDVVIADIQMPRMSGIELAEAIRAISPETVIYFLTSYEELAYVRSAVKLGIKGYLLKHEVTRASLEALLREASDQIHKHRLAEAYSRQAAFSALTEEVMAGRVFGDMESYRLIFPGDYHLLFLIRDSRWSILDSYFPVSESSDEAKDILPAGGQLTELPAATVRIRRGTFAALVSSSLPVLDAASLLRERLSDKARASFSAFIAAEKEDIVSCARLCQQCDTVKSLKIFFPPGCTVYLRSMGKVFSSPIPISFDEPEELFLSGDFDRFIEWVDHAYLRAIERKDLDQLTQVTRFLCEKICLYNDNATDIASGRAFHLDAAKESSHWYDAHSLHQWMRKTLREMFSWICIADHSPYSAPVRQAIALVNQRYGEPGLSLDIIAGELGLSAGHLNVLFKKETGETLWHLIIKVRMEHARRLLIGSDTRIAEIASACGYVNVSYFAKTFREIYGDTPNVFKRKHHS